MKAVHAGEWVKVRRLMNKRFDAWRPCALCRELSCSVVWYSIRTREVRCQSCMEQPS